MQHKIHILTSDTISPCPECSCVLEIEEKGMEAKFYSDIRIFNVTVHALVCNNNNCKFEKQEFDGTSVKIFNVNNKTVYSHTLLNGYTSSMTRSCTAMDAFRTNILRTWVFKYFIFYILYFIFCDTKFIFHVL